MDYPIFKSKTEEISFMRDNQDIIIAEKKMTVKTADVITFSSDLVNDRGDVSKAEAGSIAPIDASTIKVRSVINTTNIVDSHSDLHVKGIWTRSLKEQKNLYLLQEHQMTFKNIISDEVKAMVKTYEWKDLGFDFEGKTQALIFDSIIKRERNEYMFEQYAKGHVKNHSVGMRYMQLAFASADEERAEEYALWKTHISSVANREEIEEKGWMWIISQAKIIEGSAVPMGSNFATPTLDVQSKDIQQSSDTDLEQSSDTQKRTNKLFY